MVIGPVPPIDAQLLLSIGGGDALREDDECYVVLTPEKKIPVVLVSKPDILIESALATNPELDVSRLDPKDATDAEIGALNAVFIFNKVTPPNLLSRPFLAISPEGETGQVYPSGEANMPRVIDWDAGNPLLEYVSIAGISVWKSRQAKLGAAAKTVIDGSAGPLLVSGEEEGNGYVVMLFSPADSDLPLRPSFPILLHNIVLWLSKSARGADPYNAAVGRPWRFPVPPDTDKALLVAPDGRTIEVIPKGGFLSGLSLAKTGLWRVKTGDDVALVAASLVDEYESNLLVKNAILIGGKQVEGEKKTRASKELYGWLLLFALAVFMSEWYLYHKRSF